MISLKEEFENYHDLSKAEQESFRNSLLETANQNPAGFISLVHQAPFGSDCPLPIIYQALANDLDQWGSFFVDEFQRLYQLARTAKNPKQYLCNLKEYYFIDPENFKEREALVQLAISELENEQPIFRHYAYNTLFEIDLENDHSMDHILQRGLYDPDWRIRYWTWSNCDAYEILPDRFNLSWLDKLKAYVFDVLKYG